MFLKRSKVARELESWKVKRERRLKKEKTKKAEKADADARWEAIRQAVYTRDAGRCRATGVPLELHSRNPYQRQHSHHLEYRSAGGPDELWNIVSLSAVSHVAEHDGLLEIHGKDANKTLRFVFKDAYGNVLKEVESPNPTGGQS